MSHSPNIYSSNFQLFVQHTVQTSTRKISILLILLLILQSVLRTVDDLNVVRTRLAFELAISPTHVTLKAIPRCEEMNQTIKVENHTYNFSLLSYFPGR